MKQCPVCKTEVQDDVTLCPLCHTRVTSPITAQQIFYKKSFKWSDISIILGFCASILGCFNASFLLFPLSLITSIIGFQGNSTRKLAIAGIVISTLGLLIKITIVLQETQVLPPWLINGLH